MLCMILVFLTGCTTEQDRDVIIKQLRKKGYIVGNNQEEYYWTIAGEELFSISAYNYVYRQKDDSLTQVVLSGKETRYDESSSNTYRDIYLPYFKVDITTNVGVEMVGFEEAQYSVSRSDNSVDTRVYLVREKFLLFNYWKDYTEEAFEARFTQ